MVEKCLRDRTESLPHAATLCNWQREVSLKVSNGSEDSLFASPSGCAGCGDAVCGLVMVAGACVYHPECFLCGQCQRIIGVSEPFVLLPAATLCCEKCWQNQHPFPERATPLLRLLTLPPASRSDWEMVFQEKPRCCLCVVKIGESTDICAGDEIMEVDGCPVTVGNWKDFVQLIRQGTQQLPVALHRPSEKRQNCAAIPPTAPRARHSVSPINPRPRSLSLHRRRSRSSSLPRYSTVDETDCAGPVRPNSGLGRHPERSSKQELMRGVSHRAHDHRGHRSFRPSDLVEMEEIGRGTYGVTAKICHRETGEIMTMKKLYRFDRVAQEDFLRESAVLRNVDHPNVLRFIGVVIKGYNLHIITEYVAGGTLEDRIKDLNQPFAWSERVGVARDIAAGLAHLHSLSIIHRDLKVDNCLIREDGSVVVADFGLACILQKMPTTRHSLHAFSSEASASNSEENLSQSSSSSGRKRRVTRGPKRQTVCGNAFCMAPEMLQHCYDERVDIFSFAIILIQMLARIPSDPETGVPRSRDFGLDGERIQSTLVTPDTPPLYVTIALLAGEVDPDRRPPFNLLHSWLDRLLLCLDAHLPVSLELQMEVQEFIKNADCEAESERLFVPPHPFLRATSAPFFDVGSVDSGCGEGGDSARTSGSSVRSLVMR